MNTTIAYVSCSESNEIHAFALNVDRGEIRLLQRLATKDSPLSLKVSPDRRVLYAGMRSENSINAFRIDGNNGELAFLGGVPSTGSPTYVSCDQAMRVAFSASYGENCLEVFPLDANGVPQAACQIERDLPHAHAALMEANNRWLLVPTLGADVIRIYRLEMSRILPNDPPMTPVRTGSGPRHPVFSPDNRYVHCLNELDGSVDLFDFDARAGTLSMKQSVSMMPPGFGDKPWAAELRATPDGRFLYATDRRASTIAAFAVDRQDGQLTLIDHYPTEAQPRGMGIDPSGRWLIAAGQISAHLTVYSINPDNGRLTAGQRLATGKGPICVEITGMN